LQALAVPSVPTGSVPNAGSNIIGRYENWPAPPSGETCNARQRLVPLAPGTHCSWVSCPRGLHFGAFPAATEPGIDIFKASRMSGLEFELFVRDRLVEKGYAKARIETTPVSGDYGADLIVRQDQKLKVIVIQCKRSASAVGV
jgi:hypothetical protein